MREASPGNVVRIIFADMAELDGLLNNDVLREMVTDAGFYVGLT